MSNIRLKNLSNRTYGDRFIPNRSNANTEMAHFKLKSNDNNKIVKNDIFSLKTKDKNKYRDLLQLTINYQESKIYSFRNKSNIQSKKRSPTKVCSQWPCIPRRYPVASKPDIILDWPINNVEIKWNIVDWGSNGYMATIWGEEVFLWCNKDDQREEITRTKIKAYGALRWNNSGKLLAVAGRKGLLSLWAFPEKKYLYTSRCPFHLEHCEMSCLAWDQTDTYLVSGCSGGILCIWDLDGNPKDLTDAHWSSIISLAFNASNKYLCSSSTDGKVRLWHWPNLEPHVEIDYCAPVRAIAFHPWRPSLLAVGGGLGDGSLSIWNVSTCQRVGYHHPDRKSMVDCLAWNRITGELVSSHQVLGRNRREDVNTQDSGDLERTVTKVLVLAGLEKVVDSLDVEVDCGRILYLMWDKTGTKLATACTNENLVIWNFLGVRKNSQAANIKNKILAPSKRSVLSNFEKYIR